MKNKIVERGDRFILGEVELVAMQVAYDTTLLMSLDDFNRWDDENIHNMSVSEVIGSIESTGKRLGIGDTVTYKPISEVRAKQQQRLEDILQECKEVFGI